MTPEGRAPVSVKPIGVSPVAVTEKVPAVFSAKVVDVAEVNTGTEKGHRQSEGLGGGVGVGVGGGDGDRVVPGGAQRRRTRQGAVRSQGDPRGQGSDLGEADRGVPVGGDREGPGAVLGEGSRCRRGEHRCRGGHRQGEGLGRGVGVGVGGGERDRVAAGGVECRGTRQGAVGPQGHSRGQGAGLGEADRVSPVAVTEKVPALVSLKVVDAPEVNTGARAVTVRVKAWVEVLELASVAVMVIG